MGRPGGTADSLLKQTFRPSPRSGGSPASQAIGETFAQPAGNTEGLGWREAISARGRGFGQSAVS